MRLIVGRWGGKCDCVSVWAVFTFTCINEHCQKQGGELHGPLLSIPSFLMKVNIIYYV